MIVLIKIVCIVLAVAIIALVLLQQGKGSDLGSAFGGGSSNSMFGALGPFRFFRKTNIFVSRFMVSFNVGFGIFI
jgi:preprotein translocase subunit SecG